METVYVYKVHLFMYMLGCATVWNEVWTNCIFLCNMSCLLRKEEDMMTISKFQSLTLVRKINCTLKVPKKTTTFSLHGFVGAEYVCA